MATSLSEKGQRLYDEHLRDLLEPKHVGEFVAIEPDSGCYFLGRTALDALLAGRKELPEKLFYLMRIGYDAADWIGSSAQARRL